MVDLLDIAFLLALLFSLCFFGLCSYLISVHKDGDKRKMKVKVKIKSRGSWWWVPCAPILAFIVVVAMILEMVGLLLEKEK